MLLLRPMSKKAKLWIFLVWSPLVALLLVGSMVYYKINIWKYEGPAQEFLIKPGESFARINYHLQEQGLISSAKLFYRYSQINDLLSKFKSGKYIIEPNSNMVDVANTLIYGHSINKLFTIPEGKNLYEIGKQLASENIVPYDEFVTKAKDARFVKDLGLPAATVEGYLFPDSYNFPPNSSVEEIIRIMVKQFKKKTSHIDFQSAPLAPHDVIVLASVVEKETGAESERAIIAGVFYNRLKKSMPLQSDPTTIYGIWESFSGNLSKKDLQQETPYNTYRIRGLPAGPICNPGLKAIEAVMKPEQHNYIYFVSQNDGTHQFSQSYEDHQKAVNSYQRNPLAREGKSWRDLNKKEGQAPTKNAQLSP